MDKPSSSVGAAAAADHLAAPRSLPGLPRDADGPVFREPWEAQAFALAVALNARGVFGWDEWAAALGEEIKTAQQAGDPDTGATYYHHWLRTLERMVARKGVADRAALTRYRDAWARAAGRTPHGAPITLTEADLAETDFAETDFTETGF